jgi:gamma-glutamyltranspeptidase/glutathione hydrolase
MTVWFSIAGREHSPLFVRAHPTVPFVFIAMRKIWLFGDLCRRTIFHVCRAGLITTLLAGVSACNGDMPEIQFGRIGQPAKPSDLLGVIAGDEPQAVLAGEKLLRDNGNAADAAVAVAMALAVTLPSRAGLGGGGACIVHDNKSRKIEELEFLSDNGAPALVRGLFALHARYGRRPWAEAVAPAATLAQSGGTVSRAFANDLIAHGKVLMNDSAALDAFLGPDRRLLAAGDNFRQPALAEILANVQRGRALVASGFAPRWIDPHRDREGDRETYALQGRESKTVAWGAGFVVTDGFGNAVSCALTVGAPFGAGRMTDGVLASAGNLSIMPLVASIAVDRGSGEARAGSAGLGQGLLNTWTCGPGGHDCTSTADNARGAYALKVVRDTRM